MKCALGVIALAACGTPSRPATATRPVPAPHVITQPIAADALPGLRWITPLMPWRTPSDVDGIFAVPDDPRAVLLTSREWIGVMDLTTGTLRTQRRMQDARAVVQLLDGRVVVFSASQGFNRGAFIDPTTLVTTADIELSATEDEQPLDAIVAPFGELVAALPGQPLAILDPQTLQAVRELSPFVGTYDLHATSDAVNFTRKDPNYTPDPPAAWNGSVGSIGHRNSPYINDQVALRPGGSAMRSDPIVAARGDVVVYGDDFGHGPGFIWRGTKRIRLNQIGTVGALDAFDHLASVVDGVVTIISTVDGSIAATVKLGDPHVGGWGWRDHAAFIGDRLVVAFHGQVRVVDISAKTVSAPPRGPTGEIKSVAVDNAGHVESLGHDHVRYADGHAVASEVIDGVAFNALGGDVGTYALYEEDKLVSVQPPDYVVKGWVTSFIDGKRASRIPVEGSVVGDAGWTGNTSVVVDGPRSTSAYGSGSGYGYLGTGRNPEPHVLMQWDGAIGWFQVIPYAWPIAMDPDARAAVIPYPAGLRLVDLATGEPHPGWLPRPSCAARAELERGGARIGIFDAKTATLVDRATQKVTASIDLTGTSLDREGTVALSFLRGRDDVVLQSADWIGVWSPATAELRTARMIGAQKFATSPDGRQLAIAFENDRVALVDFTALRAALPVHRAPEAHLSEVTECHVEQ